MREDQTNTSGWSPGLEGQQCVDGAAVFDAAGEKVGSVREHNMQAGYLVVHKGWLFPKDVYVPLSAIGRGDSGGIYLNLYKDELKNQNWENPPTQPGGAGTALGSTVSTNTAAAKSPLNATGTTPDMDQPGTHATPVGGGDVSVPVHEEELIARKEAQEAGRVQIHKDVVEEPRSIEIPVTHEEISIERVPTQGAGQPLGPDAFQERDIEVPVMGEQVTTEKRAKVGEEIHLHKQEVTEQQRFDDTVRKERVNLEAQDQQGNIPLREDETRPPVNP